MHMYVAVASCSPKESLSGFLTGIESSGWLKHVHLVLEASIFSAKASCLTVMLGGNEAA